MSSFPLNFVSCIRVNYVFHSCSYDHENAHDAELMEAEEARLLKLLDEHEATHPPQ